MTDTRKIGSTDQSGAATKRRKSRGQLGCLLAVVVLVGICVAGRYLPGGSIPILIAIVVVGFLLLMRGILHGTWTNRYGAAMLIAAGAGSALLFYPVARLGGVLLLCLAAALLPPFAVEFIHHGVTNDKLSAAQRAKGPLRRDSRVIAAVVGVCLGLLVLGQVGGALRSNGGYYKRYGTPVHADAVGHCSVVTAGFAGRRTDTHYVACDGTSWQLGANTITGTLKSDYIGAFNWGDKAVPAYAIDDIAYAANRMPDYGPVVILGKLPSAALSVPFPIALVAWIIYGLVQRRTRRSAAS